MQILNIAGYKFTPLTNLIDLKAHLEKICQNLDVIGTILLSEEGINLNLAGEEQNISKFKDLLLSLDQFNDMTFRESYSESKPFRKLKVKIKSEIITFKQKDSTPKGNRAPDISPKEMKQWLDENRDFTLLDTRNDYEMQFGTFKKAVGLDIQDFSELPSHLDKLPKEKPVVMFCTGGIRCEKAALNLLNNGFNEVKQLDGGILNYFKEVGGDHYEGECFVFDARVALDAKLKSNGTQQCETCFGPILNPKSSNEHTCPSCITN